jgi:TrpR-related protein YerC/YecD
MNWNTPKTDQLCDAILQLRSREELKRFLRDLMTEEEITECAQRWQAARMLNIGMSYQDIQKQTGLSSTTVARISLWFKKGMGGYRLALDRMHHHDIFP